MRILVAVICLFSILGCCLSSREYEPLYTVSAVDSDDHCVDPESETGQDLENNVKNRFMLLLSEMRTTAAPESRNDASLLLRRSGDEPEFHDSEHDSTPAYPETSEDIEEDHPNYPDHEDYVDIQVEDQEVDFEEQPGGEDQAQFEELNEVGDAMEHRDDLPVDSQDFSSGHPSYYQLCKRFHVQMERLEARYPEVVLIKTLIDRLIEYASRVEWECSEGESVVPKLLSYVVNTAEDMQETYWSAVVHEKDPGPVEVSMDEVEELIAEPEHPGFVGSVRGIPGVNYPNYTEVPVTSFTCSDKKYIPGFYADLETGCQVFHVCYEHRRESFLCPLGTTFNQPILACDYWYSSNCSLSTAYYDVNAKKPDVEVPKDVDTNIGEIITTIVEKEHPKTSKDVIKTDVDEILKFLPVKAEVLEYEPVKPIVPPVKILKPYPIAKGKVVKAKLMAAASVPVKAKLAVGAAVKTKVLAAAVPVVKAKVVAKALPVVKTKLAASAFVKSKVIKAAVPAAKVKVAAVPVLKIKAAAKVVPALKLAAFNHKVVPAMKLAAFNHKVVPALKLAAVNHKVVIPKKMKMAALPVAKAAMISPLTKKALAAGYLKLLKAKKLGLLLMG